MAPHCHIHFDDDQLLVNNCRISTKDYLFIIDGTTESGHEEKLFWGEQHFELLKNTEPCEETITEFEKPKQQIDGEICINLNDLHTGFVVSKKTAVEHSTTIKHHYDTQSSIILITTKKKKQVIK